MKSAALGLAGFMFFAITAGAALLFSDSFDYPDGALVTVSTNLWVHHSGSVTGEVMVASGRVLLSEANTEDVHALLAGQPYPASGATNVFYAGFTVKFTTLPNAGRRLFRPFQGCGHRFSGAHLGVGRGSGARQIPAGNFLHQRLGHQRHQPRGFEP